MPRLSGRSFNQIRQIKVTKNYIVHPHGSVLFQMGGTRVLCSASIDNKVPSFLRDQGQGWVLQNTQCFPHQHIQEHLGKRQEESSLPYTRNSKAYRTVITQHCGP